MGKQIVRKRACPVCGSFEIGYKFVSGFLGCAVGKTQEDTIKLGEYTYRFGMCGICNNVFCYEKENKESF